MITFRQISDYLASGQPFTCKVVSYDRKRKQGGKVNDYEAKLLQREEKSTGRGRTRIEELRETAASGRDPNHRRWYTRNIQLLVDGHPTAVVKKIHIPLIVEFNGQPVVP